MGSIKMKINPDKIRSDFKCFDKKSASQYPIYFDNACTTLRPNQVIEAGNNYYYEHPACHNRAVHKFGQQTTKEYSSARKEVQQFLGANQPEEIVFVKNTTEALNLVANGLDLKKGDIVLTTNMEHNSNLIPWQILASEKGIQHRLIDISMEDEVFNMEAYKQAFIESKIKLVSVFQTSNVTGMTLPVLEMVQIAHENGALFMLDAAQSVAHQKIDVQKLGVDFLAFSFHKTFGPSGFGALYGKMELLQKLKPLCYGGETVIDADYDSFTFSETPYRFEAGLQNYAGAMAAAESLRYIKKIGVENIFEHELSLNSFVTKELSRYKSVNIIGPKNPELRSSIVNFKIENKDMGELSILLDKSKNIMVRSGFHCCHAWYHKEKLSPTLRLSFSIYNNLKEAEAFVSVMDQIIKHY